MPYGFLAIDTGEGLVIQCDGFAQDPERFVSPTSRDRTRHPGRQSGRNLGHVVGLVASTDLELLPIRRSGELVVAQSQKRSTDNGEHLHLNRRILLHLRQLIEAGLQELTSGHIRAIFGVGRLEEPQGEGRDAVCLRRLDTARSRCFAVLLCSRLTATKPRESGA